MVEPLPILIDEEPRLDRLERQVAALSGSGGPPYSTDMEKRVAKLEAVIPTLATKESMKELGGKIEVLTERLSSDIRVMDQRLSGKIDTLDARLSGDIAKVDERTKHMPTKFGVFGIVATLLALFGALIVFQERIMTFFNAAS